MLQHLSETFVCATYIFRDISPWTVIIITIVIMITVHGLISRKIQVLQKNVSDKSYRTFNMLQLLSETFACATYIFRGVSPWTVIIINYCYNYNCPRDYITKNRNFTKKCFR